MRIDRIRIQNFRRLKFVDLELPDGVIALIGRNGAGKSSLLESIGWCLYGHDAARTGKDLLKRRGAAPGDDVRVLLAFRFGAHEYEVTRELLGKSESHVATVKVDGKLVVPPGAASHKEATLYVERLLHMDREAFFTTLVARQRELSALTDAKASDRKRLLIGLLRLDAVDGAIQAARARRRDARAELAGLRSALRDPNALAKEAEGLRLAADAEKARVAEAEARIVALVDEVESLRERREEGRKRAEEHRQAVAQIRLVETRLGYVTQQRATRAAELARAQAAAAEGLLLAPRLAQLPDAKARLERLAALRVRHEEHARLHAERAKAEADAAKALGEAQAAEHAMAGLSTLRSLTERVAQQRPVLAAQLDAATRSASEVDATLRERARVLHEVESKEKRIREMGPETPCPTCTRPLREHHGELLHGFRAEMDEHRRFLAEARAQRDAAETAKAAAKKALDELVEREKELRDKFARLAREEERVVAAKARHQEATGRLARVQASLAALAAEPYDAAEEAGVRALVKELDALAQKCAKLASEAEREAELLGVLEELRLSEEETRAQLAEATGRRDALGFDAAAFDAMEKATRDAEAKLTEARVLRERLTAEVARKLDAVKSLDAEIARQSELAHKASALESRALLLEQLAADRDQGLLPEFKDHLIGRLRPLLSNHAGRLFRELTEGRYADLEVGDDYGLVVHDEGKPFELARFSGGEGDLANLCLRLAVSQVVAERAGSDGFGFLALDEIFGSQDEIRKQNILLALKGLSGRFRQILIITHIADVKDAAETVLRVEAHDDGTSTVSVEP